MRVALTKLPGVESAEVSLDKASADIRLKADNHVTMTQLRDVLRKNGYPSRDAHVELRARIVDRGGTPVADLLNGTTMDLEGKTVVLKAGDQIVQLVGVSRADGKKGERLAVESIR